MAMLDVMIPDIGDFKNVPIIEVHVKVGDILKAEDPIVTLESDKASLEVPSPGAGKVVELLVKLGDKVSMGVPVLRLESAGANGAGAGKAAAAPQAQSQSQAAPSAAPAAASSAPSAGPTRTLPPPIPLDFGNAHASPSVRRVARELDIDLMKLKGTGDKGRITLADVKAAIAGSGTGGGSSGSGIPDIPVQDFAKYGPIETKPLSRMKKLSGAHLHRAWLNVPHVTHTDEADITDIEAYRRTLDNAAKEKGYRVTLLSFLLKAAVSALKAHPEFNSSLSPDKGSLIYKKYYHIGVAVDTPDGLVVPVIKDVDRKGVTELSHELAAISKKMREGKIAPSDIQGATFSIS